MGANTGRVSTVLVANTTGANTGTSAANIAANDILLLNSLGAVVADAGKVSDAGNHLVYVAGTGADGKIKQSNPIQVRNIRKVTIRPYEATVQHKVVIDCAVAIPAANLVAGGEYGIMVQFTDNNRIEAELPTRQFFYHKAGATAPTAAQVAQGIADKINGVNQALANMRIKLIKATVAGAVLTIEGLPVDTNDNGINQYQFIYFDVTLRSGFDFNAGGVTVTAGKPGKGIGLKVKDLEQSTLGRQLRRGPWPIIEADKKALASGKYNLIVIEHGHEHIGDLQGPQVNPVTTVIAFETGVNIDGVTLEPSAKQAAFVTKLTSLVESAGVFVS